MSECYYRKQAAWKREGGFDRNEIIAERHERTLRRLYAGYDPELIHVGGQHYKTRRPPTPEEFTAGIKADVDKMNGWKSCSHSRRRHNCCRAITGATPAAAFFCFQNDNRQARWSARCNKLPSTAFRSPTVREARSRGSFQFSGSFRYNTRRDNFISCRSLGVCKNADEPATARGGTDRQIKQAV